jgi:hypothetical protein
MPVVPVTAWFHPVTARGGTSRLVVVLLAILAALASGACSSGGSTVNLPAKATPTGTAAAPTPSPTATSARQAVIAAEMAIWQAGDRAERSGSAVQARAILSPYATPTYIRFMIAAMRPFWQRHELAWGRDIEHVKTVTIYGRTAFVLDCQDASHHSLARASTGNVISSTYGPAHAKLDVMLVRGGQRWRVNKIEFMGSSCRG